MSLPLLPSTLVPVGSLIAYAGLTTSSTDSSVTGEVNVESMGWMVCDGRELEVVQYPELYNAIGFAYGGSVDSGKFNLPDFPCSFAKENGGNEKSKEAKVSYIIKFTL